MRRAESSSKRPVGKGCVKWRGKKRSIDDAERNYPRGRKSVDSAAGEAHGSSRTGRRRHLLKAAHHAVSGRRKACESFRQRCWHDIQGGFVDEPQDSVKKAG